MVSFHSGFIVWQVISRGPISPELNLETIVKSRLLINQTLKYTSWVGLGCKQYLQKMRLLAEHTFKLEDLITLIIVATVIRFVI